MNGLHNVVFLGIGGIGMSALARCLHQKKVTVSGYDRTPSPLTAQLESEGITVWFDDRPDRLPDNIDLAIYTPAIPADSPTLQFLQNSSTPLIKRAEFLGRLASSGDCLAVAGTHGKTTTTAILGHLLYSGSTGCTTFTGGIVNNYRSNYFSTGSGPFVVEADEFDHSLLHLFPKIAAINSMDADHLDIYNNEKSLIETYQKFAQQIDNQGFLIVKKGLEQYFNIAAKVFTVSLQDPTADFFTSRLEIVNGLYHFDLQTPFGSITDINFGGTGLINVQNAITAAAIARCYNIDSEQIKSQLSTFAGVHRRLEFHLRNEKIALIDDYAHHPEEIKAAIESVRQLYPQRKLTVVFQPHLFSRTRDFAAGFAASLDAADQCFLLDIYPAREKPIEGITTESIRKLMQLKDTQIVSKEELCRKVAQSQPEVVVMLGAGDIDRLVAPMKNELINAVS